MSAARKATAGLFSFASLDAARTRATARELAEQVYHELRMALPSRTEPMQTPLAQYTHLVSAHDSQQPVMANLELFLRSKRVHNALMEQYNPLYGMSEQDRIKATARTVGLDVPSATKA
ncbi:hypothetical protein MOBT1_001213 [Malassezia obtusa]|uniref:Uncharacterized protein n=1 Tax=Malassezia obtusa TaxID=76774 RepID=A0AAF0DYX4_9BASI|nr:hypothetical protein MOBT1_001213 [Malassezia obtusa]